MNIGHRALAALAVVFAMTACGGNDSEGSEDGAGKSSDIASSGAAVAANSDAHDADASVTYLDGRPIQSLDPVAATNYAVYSSKLFPIFDGLLLDGPDETIEPRLAVSLTSEDPTTWVLRLRPGVTFTDGSPLDAEAVKFNWERFRDPEQASPYASVVDQISKLTAIDATTLRIDLTSPNATLDTVIAQTPLNLIGSPTAIEADPAAFARRPIGAGAFTVTTFDPDTEIVYERNDAFALGAPVIEKLTYKVVPDPVSAYNTLLAGDADAMNTNDIPTAADARDQASLRVVEVNAGGGSSIVFNTARPPFDDVRARRAIALAVDPEAINEHVYDGRGEVVDNLMPESSPYFDAELALPPPSRDEAQRLLDELASEGKALDVTLLTNPIQQDVAEWLTAELQSYDNVKVAIESFPQADFATRIYAGNFDMATSATYWTNVYEGMADAYGTGRSPNYAHYSNDAVDTAFATGRAAVDGAKRRDAILRVQAQVLEDVPSAPYLRMPIALLHQDRLDDVRMSPQRVILWDQVTVVG